VKISFPLPTDNKTYKYCLSCHADGVELVKQGGAVRWHCPNCGSTNDRYLHIGNTPQDGKWWVDKDNELWHESAGVFVRNPGGKYLFFERTAWPLQYTVPAGHVDNGEAPDAAAARELQEEVGIAASKLTHIATDDVVGDACAGGADAHRWHAYQEDIPTDKEITVSEEGRRPVWMTLEQAKTKELLPVIRHVIEKYGDQLK
jgi:8-oxo-dGTP pyrophosphatase MutT (NUDIX family)